MNRIRDAYQEFLKRLYPIANQQGMSLQEALDLQRLKRLEKEWFGEVIEDQKMLENEIDKKDDLLE